MQELKGWTISVTEDSWIVFAQSELSARQKGAVLWGCEVEEVTAERDPDSDRFADLGYVPPAEMIEAGWQFECERCYHGVDKDNEHEDEDGAFYYPSPVFEGQKVFCCQTCRDGWHQAQEVRQKRRAEALDLILARYPAAQNVRVCGGDPKFDVYVDFDFGEPAKTANWKSSDPDHVTIRAIDKEAWLDFKRKQQN